MISELCKGGFELVESLLRVIKSGVDETRTRGLLRDRQAF